MGVQMVLQDFGLRLCPDSEVWTLSEFDVGFLV